MMKPHYFLSAIAGTAALALAACQTQAGPGANLSEAHLPALAAAAASPTRTPANVLRDRYRHPVETLAFFGVEPDDTVVEIWPGGGWYTEILAPYLAGGNGRLILANPDGTMGRVAKLKEAHPAHFANVTTATFPAFDSATTGIADGSVDVVLTFRNVHNWRMGYLRDDKADYSDLAFRQMYAMLKPGGVLGIVDHRLPETASAERERTSGYMKVSTVRQLAEKAGFELAGSSEINANPADPADWENGVWTLPPTLALKDKDREKYVAIGESDRMTLKFVKPAR